MIGSANIIGITGSHEWNSVLLHEGKKFLYGTGHPHALTDMNEGALRCLQQLDDLRGGHSGCLQVDRAIPAQGVQ